MSEADTASPDDRHRDDRYECTECGRRVIIKRNIFKVTDKKDSVYCVCEDYGPPFVPVPEPEPPERHVPAGTGAMFEWWDRAFSPAYRGTARVVCVDCRSVTRLTALGGLSAHLRAVRSASGHANGGCERIFVVEPP